MRTEALGSTGMIGSPSGGSGGLIGGTLERRDVEALHLHHRGEDALRPVGIANQPDELARNDLPRNAEAVLHPTALFRLGHCRERVGEAVGLFLGLDGYLERDSLAELEHRSAVQAG